MREFIEKLRYTHRNPVKRGLVKEPGDWKWSSFRHHTRREIGPVEIESEWTARDREKHGHFFPQVSSRETPAEPGAHWHKMGAMSRRLEVLLAFFSLALCASTVLLQRALHPSPPLYQAISIGAANDQQYREFADEQTREFHEQNASLVRRAHIEVTALSCVALVMLYLLHKRLWSYDWAKHVTLASAIGICSGLLLYW